MQTRLLKLLAFFLFICLLNACNKNNNPVNDNNTNGSIQNYIFLKYTFISSTPYYKQSTMLCKYSNELYRFGTLNPDQIYNLDTQSWLFLPLPDSSYSRWDGAAICIRDSIYIVATSGDGNSYDILKYSPISKKYEHTGIKLPHYFDYPALCKYNNDIIFLSAATDSVLCYDVPENKLSKIAANPFYYSEGYKYKLFSSGIYKDYFYVFDSTPSTKNDFYRLNVLNNVWEEINIPQSIEKKRLFGASMGEHMILFCDSASTYTYSYDQKEWSIDTSFVPIYPRNLLGQLDYGEYSFFSEDSCLYSSEILSKSIWKISIK